MIFGVMAAIDLAKELSDLKVTLRACLQGLAGSARPKGVDMDKLPKEYFELAGEPLDFVKFGYKSLYEFLMAMPDVAVLRFNPDSTHIDNIVSPVVDSTSYSSAHAIYNANKAKNASFIPPLPPEEIAKRRAERHKANKRLENLSERDVLMQLMQRTDRNLTCLSLLQTIPKYGCVLNATVTDNGRSAIISFASEREASKVRSMQFIPFPDGTKLFPVRPAQPSNKKKSKNNKNKKKGHNNYTNRTPNGPRSPASPSTVSNFGMASNNNFSNNEGASITSPPSSTQSSPRPLMQALPIESKISGISRPTPEEPVRPIISVHPVYNVLEAIVNFLHSRYNGVWPRKAEDFPDYIDSLVVTSTVDACRFWAHCDRGNEFLEWEENQRKLNKEVAEASAYSTLPGIYAIGAALFEDNVYYRCIVANANTFNHKLDVFYFDYGNSATIDGSTFRHLPPKYLVIPPQAVAGRVSGLEVMDPDNQVKQEKGRKLLEGLVRDKRLRATIVKTGKKQDFEIQFSELCATDDTRVKSINQLMGLTQFASFVDGTDEKIALLPECSITTINSRNEIYTRTAKQSIELKVFQESINKAFIPTNYVIPFRIGNVVLCCLHNNVQRAVILKFLPTRQNKPMAQIRFIDYGNIAEVESSTLYRLRPIDRSKSTQCTRLLLSGIIIDFNNPETKSFLMSKIKKSMKLKYICQLSADGIEGDLIDAETSLSLSQELVNHGFAAKHHDPSNDVKSSTSSEPSSLPTTPTKVENLVEINTATAGPTSPTLQAEPLQQQQTQQQSVSPKAVAPSPQPEKHPLGSWPYCTLKKDQSSASAFEKPTDSNTNQAMDSNTIRIPGADSNTMSSPAKDLNEGSMISTIVEGIAVYKISEPVSVAVPASEVVNRLSPVSFDSGRSSSTPSPAPYTDASVKDIDVETVEIPSIHAHANELSTIQQTDNSKQISDTTGPQLPDNPTIPWNGIIKVYGYGIVFKNGQINNDSLMKQTKFMENKIKKMEEIRNNLKLISEMKAKERHGYYAQQRKEKLTQHIRNEVLETELLHAQLELSAIEQQRDELLHQL